MDEERLRELEAFVAEIEVPLDEGTGKAVLAGDLKQALAEVR